LVLYNLATFPTVLATFPTVKENPNHQVFGKVFKPVLDPRRGEE
jgi:hypothetical protein